MVVYPFFKGFKFLRLYSSGREKIRFPSCFLSADNYTEIRFISHFYLMLTKRQLILILIAVLAVIAAGATLFWMKKMDQMFQNPMP